MDVKADFIVDAYGNSFEELRQTEKGMRGIWTNATLGPCDGEKSDHFPASDESFTAPHRTCRPQLHAAGIGTWVWEDYCLDPALRPVGGASEDTVYAAVTQLGHIFNVPDVARQLNANIRNDFAIAEAALAKSGHSGLKAVRPYPHAPM